MNLKTPSTYLLIILLALQLTSCAPASPTPEIITPTPLSTLTSTATPIPSETPTPKPTETTTASPTPKIQLHGFVKDYGAIPQSYTPEDVRAAYELAKASVTSDTFSPEDIFTRFLPKVFAGPRYDEGVFISCHSTSKCVIDTFATTDGIYFVTYRMNGIVDNGTKDGIQGTIVMPIVINGDNVNQNIVNQLINIDHAGNRTLDSFIVLTKLDPRSLKPTNLILQNLHERITSNARVVKLLAQIYKLAADGKLPSQALIDELLALNPYAFIQK